MLIKEIRDRFSAAVERAYGWCIIIFVFFNLMCWAPVGFVIGNLLGHALLLGFMEAVIGLLTGCILGNLAATSWCGIAATVIHISETNEMLVRKLKETFININFLFLR